MTPVYGLAESTVALLVPPLGRGPLVDRIDRASFMRDRKAQIAPPDDHHPLRFVACGRPIPGHRIRIVDEAGAEVGERIEGRLEFQGPSATAGYFRNPEETRRLIHGTWLDTADRAYIAEGDVYITGRVKDIIIRAGHHLYPSEIEEAVGVLPGVRKGCVAAFGSRDRAAGTERLVVLAETRETDDKFRESLRAAIMRRVTEVIGEPADDIVLAPPHTVLKTSSGKIRRGATRDVFEAGLVGAPSRSVWWQFMRLGWAAARTQLQEWFAPAKRLLYGIYALALFFLIAPIVWLITVILPKPAWAWGFNHKAARFFLLLAGIPLQVKRSANLWHGTPHIVVANHASYLDSLMLIAALRSPHRFVAKRELLEQWTVRLYLRRLGAEFVERSATQQSIADAERLTTLASSGASFCIFPEGTFRNAPGLLAFHLGAFTAAVQARIPIVPLAIRGTRSVLADGEWLPHHGTVSVVMGEAIPPPEDDHDQFAKAVTLRDRARVFILQQIDEPDVAAHHP
jgi:1-acyl-sn-glycerol-3-phosphate acyltransferase